MLFAIKDGTITPVLALLQDEKEVIKVDLTASPLPVAFTKGQVEAYREAQSQEKARADAEYAVRQKQAAEERARERASWPEGAVGKITSGALLCDEFKSAVRASAIRRANNPYASMPDDCITLPRDGFVNSVQHLNGGVALIAASGVQMYTLSEFIEE